ncbi:MAG: hypothetical protein ABSC17_01290 [Thermacetogeniaceae bacterium]
MPENVEREIWSEARNLLKRWDELTGEIEALVVGNETGKIAPLLQERQQLSDRLDALKERHGIVSWAAQPTPGSQTAEMTVIREEVGATLQRLTEANERIKQAMQARLRTLAQEIDQVRQTRVASHTYRTRQPTNTGAFIDTKR